jgi:hypothetical protein
VRQPWMPVTADNGRSCVDYQQYIGQIVNGLGTDILMGAYRFPDNSAITEVEPGARKGFGHDQLACPLQQAHRGLSAAEHWASGDVCSLERPPAPAPCTAETSLRMCTPPSTFGRGFINGRQDCLAAFLTGNRRGVAPDARWHYVLTSVHRAEQWRGGQGTRGKKWKQPLWLPNRRAGAANTRKGTGVGCTVRTPASANTVFQARQETPMCTPSRLRPP